MNNLVGKKWGELQEKEREMLLKKASTVDGRTGNELKEQGECIVDFEGTNLSVSGYLNVTEDENSISIEDDALIYDSTVGIFI